MKVVRIGRNKTVKLYSVGELQEMKPSAFIEAAGEICRHEAYVASVLLDLRKLEEACKRCGE